MTLAQTHAFSSPFQTLDIASCDAAARRIHSVVSTRPTDSGLTKSEITSVLNVLNYLSTCEQWEKVIDISSKSILIGVGPNARIALYRYWCEALRESFNVESLNTLSKHFISQARENRHYASLALMCLCYVGRSNLARVLANHLKNFEQNDSLSIEAYSLYLSCSIDHDDRKKGLLLYQKVLAQKTVNYFSYIHFIQNAFEDENFVFAADALKQLQQSYPLAPLPHLVAAKLSLQQNDYIAALHSYQNILDCQPNHQDAILGFAECLEQCGDLLAAKNFLIQKEDVFDFSDADFCLTYANILEKCSLRYHSPADKKLAINYYASALKTFQKLGLPEANLHIKLLQLDAGVLEQKVLQKSSQKKYWVLSLSEKLVPSFLVQENFIARCPQGMNSGDYVFIARQRPNEKQMHIEGLFQLKSDIVPDSYFGNAILFGKRKLLDSPVDIKPDTNLQAQVDINHVKNFSEVDSAHFYEIPTSFAEKIVERIEALTKNSSLQQKAI